LRFIGFFGKPQFLLWTIGIFFIIIPFELFPAFLLHANNAINSRSAKMILAGDTGGTKTRLALYEQIDGKFVRRQTETFASPDFPSLEEIIRSFLAKNHVSVKHTKSSKIPALRALKL
jgi:hypothetical protein